MVVYLLLNLGIRKTDIKKMKIRRQGTCIVQSFLPCTYSWFWVWHFSEGKFCNWWPATHGSAQHIKFRHHRNITDKRIKRAMSEPGLKFNPLNSSWTEPNTSGGPEITWYLQWQSHAEQNDFTVDPASPHHFYSPHTSSWNHFYDYKNKQSNIKYDAHNLIMLWSIASPLMG